MEAEASICQPATEKPFRSPQPTPGGGGVALESDLYSLSGLKEKKDEKQIKTDGVKTVKWKEEKLQRFSLRLCIILPPIHPFSMKSSSTAPLLAAAPRHYSCSLREAEEKHHGIYMESVQVITAAWTAFTSR